MRKFVKAFVHSEEGAVTVDWVVLTALIVGVRVLLLLTPLRNALTEVSTNIGNKASEYEDFMD
ncbi:hypothetical protein MASR1M32_17330 [Rhodobacter sp.]